ncbi:MAG: DUF3804 family protein [Pseudomonadota bacterium]|nr:DUF3804 family protein [Pseudomonadota bacterium]
MSTDKNEIMTLLEEYTTSNERGSLFLTCATNDFKFIRPSGNPIDSKGYANMFESGEIQITASALSKMHKLEVYGEIAFAAFTQTASFTYKGTTNNDVFTVSALLKKVNGNWIFAWMHRSTGEADISTWA